MKYNFFAFLVALFLSGTRAVANEATQCFELAWAHPKNGGLELTTGQAVGLCKSSAVK